MRREGDFEEFYRSNYGRIVAVVAAMLGDRLVAEDVAQEAFTRALARWSRLGGYELPEVWLRRVAVRIAIDHGRQLRRAVRITVRLASQRHDPQQAAGDSLEFTGLGAALRRLPLRERQVVALYYLADMSIDQIAIECGLAPGTVKTRLFTARRRLEQELSERTQAARDAR